MRDLYSNLLARPSINPATYNASVNGASVDRDTGGKMYQAAMIVIQTGAITDGSHAITVEDSDDNAAFGTVAAGLLQGVAPTLVAADDNVTRQLGYLGTKRYLRVRSTVTPGATGGIYGASIVLGDPRVLPTQ
jgi:hypothetical protein